MRQFDSLRPFLAEYYASDVETSLGQDVIRLALSENPYGIAPYVIKALRDELEYGNLYPDGNATILRKALAKWWQVTEDMLIVGNGIDELILIVALAFLARNDTAIITERTFKGYRAAIEIADGRAVILPMKGYYLPVKELIQAIDYQIGIIFICNPHNPTGTVIDQSAVESLTEKAIQCGAVPIFDEAYGEYADGRTFFSATKLAKTNHNVVVLRSFSKAFGLAGLRCGYAIAPASLIDQMRCIRNVLPFNSNRLAQIAATSSLSSSEFLSFVVTETRRVRTYFGQQLERLGLDYVPSETNFVLVRLPSSSTAMVQTLIERFRILVRDATPLGYQNHIRISIGTQDQMESVVRALETLLLERQYNPL